MDVKKIIDTYLDIVKNKYICFEGTATKQDLICYLAVWFAGTIALSVVSVILGFIKLAFIGAVLCSLWNLGNLLPGIGTLVRFLNSRKADN